MSLPPFTTSFPQPQPFPASAATTDPMFGVNPFSSQNMYLPLGGPRLPSIEARRESQMALMQQMQLAAMSQQIGVELPDTTQWTPEDAATQSDQAIAKIATVNPELAEQLMQQRLQGTDSGGGFFGMLKSVVSGGLSVFGTVLDYVSRTANIIPNVAHDLVDGGDFNALEAAGGALTGEVRHNWNSVFQELGWEGGGFGGFMRATLGFAGDVLTDPITWVIPTGAGVHVGTAAAQSAETLVTRSPGFLASAAKVFGDDTAEALTGKLTQLFDTVKDGAAKESWRWGDDAAERGQALVGQYVADGHRALAADMFEAANRMYSIVGTRSARAFARGTEGFTLSSGRRIMGSEFKELAEKVIAGGAGAARTSPAWREARAMASMVGGTRVRLAMPFTSFRYISPALPGTWGFTLDNAGRFFAGQSGMKKLVGAISSGKYGASWDDLDTWMQGGWSALRKSNPDLASNLSGRLKNLGSMHYAASEAMGGITAHLSKGARAWRAGYLGYLAHGEATAIKQVVDRFLHDIHTIDVGGKKLTRQQFLHEVESTLGLSLRQSRNTVTDEQLLRFSNYLDYFPFDLDATNPKAITDWFWQHGQTYVPGEGVLSNADILARGASDPAYERATAKLASMQEVARDVTPQQRTVLQRMGRIWDNARIESGKKDAVLQDVKMNYDEVGRLHPLQVKAWQGAAMNRDVAGDWFFEAPDAAGAQFAATHGIGEGAITAGPLAEGVHLHISAGGAQRAGSSRSRKAVVRGRKWAVIDRTPGAATSDDAVVLGAREEIEQLSRASQKTMMEQSDWPTGGLLEEVANDRALAGGVTARLSKDYDGIITKNADGSMDAVVFDWQNVKTVDDAAPQLVANRGYFHRTFTQEANEWLRGVLNREGRNVLVRAPKLQSDLRRETWGMTLDEAEEFVRAQLARQYNVDPSDLPARIWNRNPLDVHSDYLTWAAQGIASEMSGAAFERYAVIGDLAPGLLSRGVRSQVYEWILSPALVKALGKTNERTSRAVQLLLERSARVLEHQHESHARTAENVGQLAADIEEALAVGADVPSRLVASIRKWGSSIADAQSAIEKSRTRLVQEREELASELTLFKEVEELVSADPLFGHPKAGEPVRYVDHADGTTTAKGWHGRIDGRNPVGAYEGVDPATMSNAGFHFGTYDQAKLRIDSLIGQQEALKKDGTIGIRTIGHRDDPSTWPLQEGPSGAVNPVRGPGEDLASHSRRVTDDRQFPVAGLTGIEVDQFGAMARQKAAGGSRNTDMAALRADIRQNGVKEPVQVRVNDDGSWSLMAGKHRITAAQEEGIDTVPVRWEDSDGNIIPAPSTAGEPIRVEPDVFYDEVLFPVEVRARLFGRAADEEVLDESAEGIDRVFSGSGRDWTDAKATAVGQWESRGYEGIIYRNDVENMDFAREAGEGASDELQNSIVIFRPDELVHDAYGPRQLRARAEMGELFVDRETRSVYTKAGNWANGGRYTKLRSDEQVASEMAYVERQLEEQGFLLEALRRGIPGELEDAFAFAEEGVSYAEALARNAVEGAKDAARRAAEAAGSTGEAVAAAVERAAKAAERRGRRERQLMEYANRAMAEANRALAEYKGVRAQLKPALVSVEKGDLRGYTRMAIPGLEGYALPDYMAAEFHSVIDQYGVGALRQGWRRYVLGPWKRWATYRWPGFHVRNFFGAWFNNFLGGVTDAEYTFAWRVMRAGDGVEKWTTGARRFVTPEEFDRYNLGRHFGLEAKGKVTYADVSETLSEQGINHANVMVVYGLDGTVEATRESYRAVGKGNPRMARRAARKYDDAMRNVGSGVEDFHRAAAWARGMSGTHGDLVGSRAFVMMRHGDYSELTPAEDFIRDLVPFYKWMRTNVPYQIRMLAENPGLVTAVADKAKTWGYEAQGIDRQEAEMQQPGWQKNALTVPIPSWMPFIGSDDPDALKFAMFDLPYADLYNGLNEYMSSGLPIVRNVLESYGTQSQWFSGKPLTGQYEKLNGVFALPGVSNILQAAGLAQAGPDGELYVQDKLQNVLMAWPVYSRFRNFVSGDAERADSRLGGLFSMIGGVGIREGDYTAAELDFFYNEVQPLLDQYRSLGIQLPTMDDIQSAEVGSFLGMTNEPDGGSLEALYPSGVVAQAPQSVAA